MIENLLSELIRPIKTIKLLNIFLEEIVEEEVMCDVSKNQYDKNESILAINYAIKLVNKDVLKLRERYYKLMCKEKFGK
ncbi:MAG: hypothetical protein IJB79_01525 [Candidatus Gastranaerophilales bacterium]|nr:hypothetical protein [Candidatus Gastranaerophilales bacterium]